MPSFDLSQWENFGSALAKTCHPWCGSLKLFMFAFIIDLKTSWKHRSESHNTVEVTPTQR